jgi:hypothetical protein
MRKYAKKLYALLCLAVLGIGLLTGCANPVADAESPNGFGKLEITLSGLAQDSERTLRPSGAPSFTKYVLSFAGPETQADVTLTAGKTSTDVTLAQGEWTVTATGYVTMQSKEYEAAQGSAKVTVGTTPQAISISMSAETSGGNPGFFTYTVTFPEDKVTSATLRLTDISGSPIRLPNNSYFIPVNLLPTGKSNQQVQLNPGYYVLNVQLRNDYQTAGHTEVIHIYAGMQTTATYAFAPEDFIDLITLSGTITFTDIPEGLESVQLYSNQVNNGRGISINWNSDSIRDDRTVTQEWSISTIPFEAPTEVSWTLSASVWNGSEFTDYSRNIPISRTVYNQDIPNIDLGTISFVPTGQGNLQLNTPSDLDSQLRNAFYTSGSSQASQSSNTSFEIRYSYSEDLFDTYQWFVDGAEKTGLNGQSTVQFNANDYALGVHYVTLVVTKGSLLGSREFSFTVVE